jgi:hypothetical protein
MSEEKSEEIICIDFSKELERDLNQKEITKSWRNIFKHLDLKKREAFKCLTKDERDKLIELLEKININYKKQDEFESLNDEEFNNIIGCKISIDEKEKMFTSLKRRFNEIETDIIKYKKVKEDIDKEEREIEKEKEFNILKQNNEELREQVNEMLKIMRDNKILKINKKEDELEKNNDCK